MDLSPTKALLGRQAFWNDHVAVLGSVGGETAASAYGESPTVLHASDAGRPIYERMGYTPISTHTLYMDAALLGGH